MPDEQATDLFGIDQPLDLDAATDIALNEKWPEVIADLFDLLTENLRDIDPDEAKVKLKAERITAAICGHFGGIQFYLPKAQRWQQAIRDNRIWREFNGKNTSELAQSYRLTEVRIYEILREQRILRRKRVQKDLFE